MTQTVPDISPLMPMHQDPLLVWHMIAQWQPLHQYCVTAHENGSTNRPVGRYSYSTYRDSKVHGANIDLGPTGPRWAPCGPREPCYLGKNKRAAIYRHSNISNLISKVGGISMHFIYVPVQWCESCYLAQRKTICYIWVPIIWNAFQ